MRYFSVVGQCTALIADQLKKIGFRNIKRVDRNADNVMIHTEEGDIYLVKVIKVYDKGTDTTYPIPKGYEYNRGL